LALIQRHKRINLALQGGGAHGAFTWGVLDRILQEEALEIGWISGTSAGAVNAVAVAIGMAEGGRAGARAKLTAVWEAVAKAGVPDLIRFNPFLAGLSRSSAFASMATMFSPYDFNPMGFDPLRKLLDSQLDFTLLRTTRGPELLIAATEVATGRARLFRRRELTVEGILASACLPTLHHAVDIDGLAYWDGGFSANPDLVTLATESPARDTLVVQLNAFAMTRRPTAVRDIAAHMSHLTFNQPYLRDIAMIEQARAQDRGLASLFNRGNRRLAQHRFHVIEAGRFTSGLSADSKGKPEMALLTYLRDAGISEAGKWLARHGADIGRRDTAELGRRAAEAGGRMVTEPETEQGDASSTDKVA
jgi:NTE family protein